MVVLLDYNGAELMTLLFNGTGSNTLDWFSKERLLSSSYDDIDIEPQNYFSVEGHADLGRHWFISRDYPGCSGDTGWMVVAYDFTPDCDWERNNALPVFLYSLTNNYTKWTISKDIAQLGLETGLVMDFQITASSYHLDKKLPEFARLNHNNYWAPSTNDYGQHHWLQVDFLSPVDMKRIQTQGTGLILVQQWVTELSIKTGNDTNLLVPIMDAGSEKIFIANTNTNDIVDIEFPVTLYARLLRIIPKAWNVWPSMRVEVIGNYRDIQHLGLASGFVQDDHITASSNVDNRLPKFGRLNYNNYWAALTNNSGQNHWLQVDFLSAVGIKGIRTQGAGLVPQWVTTLSIKTGDDENSFAPILVSGVDKIFTANENSNDIVYIEFPVTIIARLLRVTPIAWYDWPAMRMEVMGYYTDIQTLGLATGFVKDDQITASSYYIYNRLPEFGRLNYSSYWAASTINHGHYRWLQVDFLSAVGIKGIRTQGAGLVPQWVTTLSIKTGDDENSLAPIMESGVDKMWEKPASLLFLSTRLTTR
ncbi:lactadherin-like [Amphiura filiformis]|uniref:lactadherin-like n=1 Tax=Amphiura filiformis TaxID=82378 RepID=UPI003B220339